MVMSKQARTAGLGFSNSYLPALSSYRDEWSSMGGVMVVCLKPF